MKRNLRTRRKAHSGLALSPLSDAALDDIHLATLEVLARRHHPGTARRARLAMPVQIVDDGDGPSAGHEKTPTELLAALASANLIYRHD